MTTKRTTKEKATLASTKAAIFGDVGAMIDQLGELKKEKSIADAAVKEIESRIEATETTIMDTLRTLKLKSAEGASGKVMLRDAVVANIDDWDAMCAWVGKTKNFQLLQRRISAPAYRELLETKGSIPGLSTFNRVTLSYSAK